MISWIQTTFQHHFKAIFGVLLAVTIISFIATIGASPGVGRGDHNVAKAEFFGHNLASESDKRLMDGDAALSIELQAGFNPYDGDQIHQYALQRVAALHLADEWHLPSPTTEQMTDYIRTLRIFAGTDGQFDATKYATLRGNMRLSPGGETEVARVLNDDLRCNQVNTILAGPGFLQPSEVKAELVRDDTTWTVGTAEVDYASFHPAEDVSDAKVAAYFQQNALRYQIPASVLESYVAFPLLTYLREMKVTDAEVPRSGPFPQAGSSGQGSEGQDPDRHPQVRSRRRLRRGEAPSRKFAQAREGPQSGGQGCVRFRVLALSE